MKIRFHQFNGIKHLFIIKSNFISDNTIYKNIFISKYTFFFAILNLCQISWYFFSILVINLATERPKQFVIDFLQDIYFSVILILIQVAKCIILLSDVMVKRLCMQVETIFKCLLILMQILKSFYFSILWQPKLS